MFFFCVWYGSGWWLVDDYFWVNLREANFQFVRLTTKKKKTNRNACSAVVSISDALLLLQTDTAIANTLIITGTPSTATRMHNSNNPHITQNQCLARTERGTRRKHCVLSVYAILFQFFFFRARRFNALRVHSNLN